MLFNLFKISDKTILSKLGGVAYIRNGVGYGFISDENLYDNGYIEIGFGRVRSGRGDWGGGFEYASKSPLKIIIDRDYNIISSELDSFYSNRNEEVEEIALKLQKRLGNKLLIKNSLLKECVDEIFKLIPCKHHIGLNVELEDERHTKNMLQYFTDMDKHIQYDFKDAKCKISV